MHPRVGPPVVAREVLWTFRVLGEASGDRDFYADLNHDGDVTQAIRQRVPSGSPIWVGREAQLRVGAYTIQARVTNLEPVLANVTGDGKLVVRYREPDPNEGPDVSTFIAETVRYPDEPLGAAFRALIGLDTIKQYIIRKMTLLLAPQYVSGWMAHHYAANPPAMLQQVVQDRYPLLILEGEVGSGKTALARSVGDPLATQMRVPVILFVINAQVRGTGLVGQLTHNISRVFEEAERVQDAEQVPVLVLLDEADALAQSRGGSQMHHEDNAGVNALIQRIDRLRGRPIAVFFATNLVHSVDSAILRRAIGRYHFDRPTPDQRAALLRQVLAGTSITERDIARLVSLTEPHVLPGDGAARHRYTYSDLTQRLVVRAVEDAIYLGRPLAMEHLEGACEATMPTPETSHRSSEQGAAGIGGP